MAHTLVQNKQTNKPSRLSNLVTEAEETMLVKTLGEVSERERQVAWGFSDKEGQLLEESA